MKEYALYKGDDLLVIGTIAEIAQHQDVKEETIRFYQYPAYIRRSKLKYNNRKILIPLT